MLDLLTSLYKIFNMKKRFATIIFIVIFKLTYSQTDFKIAFGSCNKPEVENLFWKDILDFKPNVWIWGGDAIYADTQNMSKMKNDYATQMLQKGYKEMASAIPILGTWDDHDYGKNDAGTEYKMKKESQQLFLDFLQISKSDPIRKQEGIYNSKLYTTEKGSVKIILLDTRYHRTSLSRNKKTKHYIANQYNEGTILGAKQWEWLTDELTNSKADFNIIVSSIQVLSSQHRFEKWANFPHEMIRLLKLIKTSKASNAIFLSGDRHISEFSKTMIEGLNYPIIDFTSSGLTHAYRKYKGEENQYRDGNVIFTESFGVLKFNFDEKKVIFQIRGNGNSILEEITQTYPE